VNRLDEFHLLRAIETDECVIWPGCKSEGYGQVRYDGKMRLTHRLALTMHTGSEPAGMQAAHGPCHDRACMNVRHLYWATVADNAGDRLRDGTATIGAQHGCSKLTEDEVREIRAAEGSLIEIAERYCVGKSNIGMIRRRATWKHVA
jgi:hypothetical protein